jgi:hypothetical protein
MDNNMEVSLSFDYDKDAQPIALTIGGEFNKEVLYLHSGDGKKFTKKPRRELDIGNAHLKKLPARKQSNVLRMISEAYAKGIPPENLMVDDIGVRTLYEDMLKDDKKEISIKLPPESSFHLIPTIKPDKREIFYVAGASGSGKSYIAKGLAERYQKQFPDRDVYLVSKLPFDETLDSMKKKPIRLKIDKLMENPMKDLEPLRNSMIIFDDYDSFDGKEGKMIENLMNDISTMGRHQVVSMLCLTHYLSNYKKTRLLLTEATHFVLYPQSTGAHALSYLLKTHLGMDKHEIEKLRKNGSRWVCIQKNYPQYCVTENSAWILNQAES